MIYIKIQFLRGKNFNTNYFRDFKKFKIFTEGKHIWVFWDSCLKIEMFDTETLKWIKTIQIKIELSEEIGKEFENLCEDTKVLQNRVKDGSIYQESVFITEEYFILQLSNMKLYFFKIDKGKI